jgi:hypothetical protein
MSVNRKVTVPVGSSRLLSAADLPAAVGRRPLPRRVARRADFPISCPGLAGDSMAAR